MKINRRHIRITSAAALTGAALSGTLLVPGAASATSAQTCTGRSILFVSGRSASSDTLRFGVTMPAGVYDAMLVTADSYPDRANTDPSGQQSEIVEVAGIVSRDLKDGVESTNDITYGTFVASAPFSSVTAYHRVSTPGPNSVWVSTFCLTPSTSSTTTPATTAPATTAVPTTPVPTTATPVPTTPVPTTPVSTTATPVPTTEAVPTSTVRPSTTVAAESPTTTAQDSTVGPTTTADPGSSTTVTSEGAADPFGFGEPIPAGPTVIDKMVPSGTPAPASDSGSLPLTGIGLGVAMVGLALVASGGIATVGAKKLDAAGDAQ